MTLQTQKDTKKKLATFGSYAAVGAAVLGAIAVARADITRIAAYNANNEFACNHRQELPTAPVHLNNDSIVDYLVLHNNKQFGCFGTRDGATETATIYFHKNYRTGSPEGDYVAFGTLKEKIDQFSALRVTR